MVNAFVEILRMLSSKMRVSEGHSAPLPDVCRLYEFK